MYSSIGEQTGMKDFKKKTNIQNYKNTVKILDDTNIKNQIHLEVSYIKNNGIQIRELYIERNNLSKIIDNFKNKGFQINKPCNNNVSELENINSKTFHPEYNNINLQDFKKQGFNNSFKEKFNT